MNLSNCWRDKHIFHFSKVQVRNLKGNQYKSEFLYRPQRNMALDNQTIHSDHWNGYHNISFARENVFLANSSILDASCVEHRTKVWKHQNFCCWDQFPLRILTWKFWKIKCRFWPNEWFVRILVTTIGLVAALAFEWYGFWWVDFHRDKWRSAERDF